MRKIIEHILLVFAVMLFSKPAFNQHNYFEEYSNKISGIQYEKVFLHIDRNIYSSKEHLWFKIYLFEGKKNIPLIGQNNVYVDLVDKNGKVLIHKIYFVENGFANGDFEIPQSLKTGTYILYAYTSYMRNFGTDCFYKQSISVSQIQMSETKTATVSKAEQSSNNPNSNAKISLQFMPEGGYLTSNTSNVLAFKVLAPNGKGINLNGVVKHQHGKFIDSLICTHLGMGSLNFTPKADEKYYALFNTYPRDTFHLPVSCHKPQLTYLGMKDSVVSFKISKTLANTESEYYAAIKSKGKANLFFPLKFTKGIVIELFKSDFNSGLNQIILFDKKFNPLAERLFFIPGIAKAKMEVVCDKDVYESREKLNLTIKLPKSKDAKHGGNFSLAAINLSELGINDISEENIISYLELSSEIRGNIENAGYYFSKPYAEISKQLDLLLLTQGWRHYIWNDTLIDSLSHLSYKREFGTSIKGQAKRLALNKDLKDGKITLLIPEHNIFLETKTDSSGYFSFHNFVLLDSTEITIAGKNKKGRKNVDIVDFNYSIPSPPFFPESIQTKNNLVLSAYQQNALNRYVNDSYINFDENTILLNEVDIIQEKTNIDDDLMMEGSSSFAEDVLQPDETDKKQNDLHRYLQSKITGLYFSGSEVTLTSRGEVGTPLFMLDGSEVDPLTIKNIPMSMIDKVMVNKSEKSMSIYADSSAALGIIAIYMKEGAVWTNPDSVFNILTKKINGYASCKEFYVPSYNNTELNRYPDVRATVYWEPNIVIDSTGTYHVSYFNADNRGKIAFIVQGVLNNGIPAVETGYYMVK